MTKPFRNKIPTKYWEDIYEWYATGLTKRAILTKLQQLETVSFNERTLDRLLKHMQAERQTITEAILTDQTQKQVLGDFQKLNALFTDLEELAKLSYGADQNLYLRTVDRMVKLLQIKFAISAKTEKPEDDQSNTDEILDQLLEKLGK